MCIRGLPLGPWLTLLVVVLPAAFSQVAAQDDRLPVRDAADRERSLWAVRELYQEEFLHARTAPQKSALARKLIEEAQATTQDPAGRFALLTVAQRIAIQSGDLPLAFEAIDELGGRFQVDALSMKLAVVDSLAESAKTRVQQRALAAAAHQATEAAAADDQYAVAQRLAEVALQAARKARDGRLIRQIEARAEDLAKAKDEYEGVREARRTLDQNPSDPAACLVVGCYLCFRKGDWETGLPLLAHSEDPALRSLAAKEQDRPSSAAGMVELAEQWHGLTRSTEGRTGEAMAMRAIYWYGAALRQLSGMDRRKVEKTLEDLRRSMASFDDGVTLRIVARIDGSDTVEISPQMVRWTHHAYSMAQEVTINGFPWLVARAKSLPFTGALAKQMSQVDLTTAEVTKIRGRGSVRLEKTADLVSVTINDSAGGADTYEVVISFQ